MESCRCGSKVLSVFGGLGVWMVVCGRIYVLVVGCVCVNSGGCVWRVVGCVCGGWWLCVESCECGELCVEVCYCVCRVVCGKGCVFGGVCVCEEVV